jgi:succinate-acetate transporter protein
MRVTHVVFLKDLMLGGTLKYKVEFRQIFSFYMLYFYILYILHILSFRGPEPG